MITERHLQAIWSEQLFLKELKTVEGDPIKVYSPGIWNLEAGPDFLRGHLGIAGREVQGDIEIHLRDEGWRQHGHEENPLYDGVILHVVLWEGEECEVALTSEGKPLPTCYLESSLEKTIPEIVAAIDLDAYPYEQFRGSGRCATLLFDHLENPKIVELLRGQASIRLYNKFFYLSGFLKEQQYFFAAGIAQALGYKHNSRAFLELFAYLLKFKNESADGLFARALGATGFFDERFYKKWGGVPEYRTLYESWVSLTPSSRFVLRLDHIRPLNHPIRRLFYLSRMLKDPRLGVMNTEIQSLWRGRGKPRKLVESLESVIPTYEDSFWNSHYTFEPTSAKGELALMGADLKREIVVNAALPLLFQQIDRQGDKGEQEAFFVFYEGLKAPKSRKATYLSSRLFNKQDQRNLLKQSCYQQGAFQIHKDYCVHHEASCRGCPFPGK